MVERFAILPDTEENRTLRENVHPTGWKNPVPADCYNLLQQWLDDVCLGDWWVRKAERND